VKHILRGSGLLISVGAWSPAPSQSGLALAFSYTHLRVTWLPQSRVAVAKSSHADHAFTTG
jgi:hypothetical protein